MIKFLLLLLVVAGVVFGYLEFDKSRSEPPAETAEENALDRHVVLTDTEGRDLECEVTRVTKDTVEVIRTSDDKPFTIPLDRLNVTSRAKVAAIKLALGDAKDPAQQPQNQAEILEAAIDQVNVIMLSASWCPVCDDAEEYLKQAGINYVKYDIEKSTLGRRYAEEWGATAVPVFEVGGEVIRGFSASSLKSAIINAYRSQSGG